MIFEAWVPIFLIAFRTIEASVKRKKEESIGIFRE